MPGTRETTPNDSCNGHVGALCSNRPQAVLIFNNEKSEIKKPVLVIACVIDLLEEDRLEDRRKAFEAIKLSCRNLYCKLYHLPFQSLLRVRGGNPAQDVFNSADIVIVDFSIEDQACYLFYNLGVRESYKNTTNIFLLNNTNEQTTELFKALCSKNTTQLHTYNYDDDEKSTEPSLANYLMKSYVVIEIKTKAHKREKFLSDLEEKRESLKRAELEKELKAMMMRLDDPTIFSTELVGNYLAALRDVSDYDSMVQLCEKLLALPSQKHIMETTEIIYLYAFALNRRKKAGDKEKVLHVVEQALKVKKNVVPDMVCLCGRIYKEMYVESNLKDKNSLQKAIHWYRKGYEVEPNEYAAINLATLLVVDGFEITTNQELKNLVLRLSHIIGKKGDIYHVKDYWSVATYFESSVLGKYYQEAYFAAEAMLMLNPPTWCLLSTIGNIRLISKYRDKKPKTPLERMFVFWMDFFIEATKKKAEVANNIRFPIVILEDTHVLIPSYVVFHLGDYEKTMQITNTCLEGMRKKCKNQHDFVYKARHIYAIGLCKKDERQVVLYVKHGFRIFIYFPSDACKRRFYELLRILVKNPKVMGDMDDYMDSPLTKQEFEYELDPEGNRILLGKGTFGSVYVARDVDAKVKVAVKEIKEEKINDVEKFHEEVSLHSELRHRNIVQYIGSISQDGYVKIFMENVPGGSLTSLLKTKLKNLIKTPVTMAYYTQQMFEGVNYLHGQKIIHRDIKGENVLINTYNGCVKISDFGMSTRLENLSQYTKSFRGTMVYMAPEVIERGHQGYGAPADVWSLGCTVMEMATGKPPFLELGSPQAAVFKVGLYKDHPPIPDEMPNIIKKFVMRCFEPDPAKRKTCAQLLNDPFVELAEQADLRTALLQYNCDPPQTQRFHGQEPRIPYDIRESFGDVIPIIELSEHKFPSCSTPGSSASTISPEFDIPNTIDIPSPKSVLEIKNVSEENEKPYLLSKESQNRITLERVINEEETKMSSLWRENFKNLFKSETFLKTKHFVKLVAAMKNYIATDDGNIIKNTIKELKEEVNDEPSAVNQLSSAVNVFQDTVKSILKTRGFKPHWISSLDDVAKTAVVAVLQVLTPEVSIQSNGKSTIPNGLNEVKKETFSRSSSRASEVSSMSSGNSTVNPFSSSEDDDVTNRLMSSKKSNSTELLAPSLNTAVYGDSNSKNGDNSEIPPNRNLSKTESDSNDTLRNHQMTMLGISSVDQKPRLRLHLSSHSSEGSTKTSSLKSVQTSDSAASTITLPTSYAKSIQDQSKEVLQQNATIITELVENQKAFQTLLTNALTEQQKQMSVLTDISQAMANHILKKPEMPLVKPSDNLDNDDIDPNKVDDKLVEWLLKLGISIGSVKKFQKEECCLEDVLEYLSRGDLRRINLKVGDELKIWRAILQHRKFSVNEKSQQTE
ncbi:hypothetical protein TKK_0017237 [Trichogramma kaykai]|uniref:mitogen-activated protein kinase kinase kinase n=1 Tax=Trichogramma kaykai TaxID=54128 RepID=A0ABD2W593_9HYME